MAEPTRPLAALLAELLRSMPAPDAPAWQRVQWLFAKADLLREIAKRRPELATEARVLATAADHAAYALAKTARR